jgi:type I restriction enzyme M protein
VTQFFNLMMKKDRLWVDQKFDLLSLNKAEKHMGELAQQSRDLVKQADHVNKLVNRLVDLCEKDLGAKDSSLWVNGDINRAKKAVESSRQEAVEQLKLVRYYYRQAEWLLERFPDGEYRDVPGLVKLVDREEIKANDWSLTPGRYVGVAPEEQDEDFDFEEVLREIHTELEGLNEEATELARRINANFEVMGI